jgi:hypothetical protein
VTFDDDSGGGKVSDHSESDERSGNIGGQKERDLEIVKTHCTSDPSKYQSRDRNEAV